MLLATGGQQLEEDKIPTNITTFLPLHSVDLFFDLNPNLSLAKLSDKWMLNEGRSYVIKTTSI